MNALERIADLLYRARVSSSGDDYDVAADVLAALGLDDDGRPHQVLGRERPTSSNLEHG